MLQKERSWNMCLVKLNFRHLLSNKKRNKKMESIFNFHDYLIDNNFKQKSKKFYARGFITIKIVGNRFIAMNQDGRVKHSHITTCKLPKTKQQAETIMQLCGINRYGEINT